MRFQMDDEDVTPQTNITGDGSMAGDGSVSQAVKAEDGSTISDVIQAIVTGKVTGDLHIGDKVYTRSNLEELDDYLARAVAAYEARMYQLVARSPTPPDQPYKFLYAFEIEDADIFFGRDAASETLHRTVLKDRVTVLHAKSGAGKTSLLNAGLSSCLIREGRLPVYARAYDDLVRAIKRVIAPPSLGPWPELLPQLTLQEFLGLACSHVSRQTQELAIILDQFEEFFIFWPERDHRLPLINALADCYDDTSLPIRFIFALRKDYYSDLATFQGRLPHIFHNEFHLESVTRQEAQAAITGPVAELGYPVSYEPALLDVLLDDLARGGMELPHLQIICTELYEALAEGETTITLSSYEELGRAEGVLSGYLNYVLGRLPAGGGAVAREVFKELVTSESTKRVLSYGTLAARIEAREDELDDVLTRLVNARLLRRDEVAGQITYEMAHEYLIEEIKKWIDQADLAFKQAEELLAREVANWRVHGTLIPRDRLELLHPHRERFKGLDEETTECLVHSALQVHFAIEDWVRLGGQLSIGLLIAALRNEDSNVRLGAANGLGTTGDPHTVEPLIAALGDRDDNVRRAVAKALRNIGIRGALGTIDDPRAVETLIAALGDGDGNVRKIASSALAKIGRIAVESLIGALRDKNAAVRQMAAGALGEAGDSRAVEPLIRVLQRDEDIGTRWMAAKALGQIGDSCALKSLIAALRDDNITIRQTAAKALTNIGTTEALAAIEDWQQEQSEARLH